MNYRSATIIFLTTSISSTTFPVVGNALLTAQGVASFSASLISPVGLAGGLAGLVCGGSSAVLVLCGNPTDQRFSTNFNIGIGAGAISSIFLAPTMNAMCLGNGVTANLHVMLSSVTGLASLIAAGVALCVVYKAGKWCLERNGERQALLAAPDNTVTPDVVDRILTSLRETLSEAPQQLREAGNNIRNAITQAPCFTPPMDLTPQ
jgi:hypothetical protein